MVHAVYDLARERFISELPTLHLRYQPAGCRAWLTGVRGECGRAWGLRSTTSDREIRDEITERAVQLEDYLR